MAAIPERLGGAIPATAVSAVPVQSAHPGGPRELSLRFTGSAAEYFRVWIVNVCLSLLTLGIFSAWAKVRKKRYFYSNTVLDGTPFQYLGQPLPILKGRIIAVVLLGVWYVGTHFILELIPVVLGLGLILAPWVLVRSAAFTARYSAFRNMTFEFKGNYWSAFKVLYGWGLLTVITFGLGFSWWQQRLKRYMVTRMNYGDVPGEFLARGRQFFRTYVIAGLVFGVAISALTGISAALFLRSFDKATYFVVITVCIYAMYVAAYAYIQARLANLTWNHTQLGPLKFHSTLRARDLIGLYVTNALAILISVGLLIPWATVRTLKYRLDHFGVTADGDLGEFQGGNATSVQAAGAEVGEFFDFDMSI